MSKKEIDVGYSPENISEMREFFQNNDFTEGISLEHEAEIPAGETRVFRKAKGFFSQYWLKNLPEIGVDRRMRNFSKDQPVNFLENVDGVHFAEEVSRISSDDGLMTTAVDRFFEMYREPIEAGFTAYAKSVGKELDDLTDDEISFVLGKIADVLNEELTKVLMLGQQVPEIFGISQKYAAHEDFNKNTPGNVDALNFKKKWTHCKTRLEAPLFFSEVIQDYDDEDDPGRLEIEAAKNFFENGDEELELEYKLIREEFTGTLDETEKKIYTMLESGYTQREIADELGYKSHNSIKRRIDKIREKLTEFLESAEE